MKIKTSDIQTFNDLPEYKYWNEQISKSDNYLMHEIIKEKNSSDIFYHIMFYVNERKTTPQEFTINAKTSVIEEITIFVSDNQRNDSILNNVNINYNLKSINLILDECTDDGNGRFFKVEKENDFLWTYKRKTYYFLFSDCPSSLQAYYICKHCMLLIDNNDCIQGVIINTDTS